MQGITKTSIITALISLLIICSSVWAGVPQLISYQGRATDGGGASVTDGPHSFEFNIYHVRDGGVADWSESQSVSTSDGLFSHLLGSVSTLSAGLFKNNDSLFLEITIDGETQSPRTHLVSVAYAMQASTVEAPLGLTGNGSYVIQGSNTDGHVGRLGDDIGGIFGTNGSGNYGYIGATGEAVYGKSGSTTGKLATGTWGAYGGTTLGSYGALGNDAYGAYGSHYNGSLGYLASNTYGAYGEHSSGNKGYLGSNLYAAYGEHTSGNKGWFGTTDEGARAENANGNFGALGCGGAAPYNTGVYGQNSNGNYGTLGGANEAVYGERNNGTFGYLGGDRGAYGENGSGPYGGLGSSVSGAYGFGSSGNYGRLGTADEAVRGVHVNGHFGELGTEYFGGYAENSSGTYCQLASNGTGAYGESSTGFSGVLGGSDRGVNGSSGNGNFGVLGHDDFAVSGDAQIGPGGTFRTWELSSSAKAVDAMYNGSGSYDAAAVYGKSRPNDYYGYGGYFEGGYKGVYGKVVPTGTSYYYGLHGYVVSTTGTGTNYGVYGSASGGSTNWAGYFNGNVRVTGGFTNPVSAYIIDNPTDPEDEFLSHSAVSSPDMMNVYNGNVILDGSGEAVVQLPDYFEALNTDFRYQLTAIGAPGPNLFVADEIADGTFRIAGGQAGMKVSWMVTGIRQDAYAKANRTEVIVEKSEENRGKYLHPEAFSLPRSMGIDHDEDNAKGHKPVDRVGPEPIAPNVPREKRSDAGDMNGLSDLKAEALTERENALPNSSGQ